MCLYMYLHIYTQKLHVCGYMFTCMYTRFTVVCTPSLHVYVYIFTYMYACTYSHRVLMCDFYHVYIRLSSPRGGVIVSKCHK